MHCRSVGSVLSVADDDIDIFFRRDDGMTRRWVKLCTDRNVVGHFTVGQAAVLYDIKIGIGQVYAEVSSKAAAGLEAKAVHAFGIVVAIHDIPFFHRAGPCETGLFAVWCGEIRIERHAYEDVLQLETAG